MEVNKNPYKKEKELKNIQIILTPIRKRLGQRKKQSKTNKEIDKQIKM